MRVPLSPAIPLSSSGGPAWSFSDAARLLPVEWRALLALTALCTALGLLRVAETAWIRGPLSVAEVAHAARWRLWDWWFWVPLAAAYWRFGRRVIRRRSGIARSIGAYAGGMVLVVLAHRTYSLAGMWLFQPDVSAATLLSPRFFFQIAGLGANDVLVIAAIIGGTGGLRSAVARRMRVERRREWLRARAVASPDRRLERIAVRVGARQHVVELANVRWIEADGYCSRLHTVDGRAHVVRLTMKRLEESIHRDQFVRTHRSAIASLAAAREIRTEQGVHYLLLDDGTRVPISQSRYAAVRRLLTGSRAIGRSLQ